MILLLKRIFPVLKYDMDKPMGQVRQLDKRMSDAGLLWLMVSDPLAMNFVKKILLAVYNKIFSWY